MLHHGAMNEHQNINEGAPSNKELRGIGGGLFESLDQGLGRDGIIVGVVGLQLDARIMVQVGLESVMLLVALASVGEID